MTRFLSAVFRERVRQGVLAGWVAAAATAGVLIGFGRARGAALAPINAVAHMVVGSRALLFDHFDAVVTSTGLALHVLYVLIWGVLFSLVAARLRGARLLVAALAAAAAIFIIDQYLVPPRFRPGFEQVLSGVEVGVVYATLAIALAIGVKLARSAADIS